MSRSCLLFCLTVLCVPAQSLLSLSDAIREARQQHPQIRASQERVAQAAGFRTQAALRLNPRLLAQAENYRSWGTPDFSFANDTDDFLTLTQVFEVAGKRRLRTEVGQALLQTAEAERALIERQVASRVSVAYWTAVAAASLRDLLEQDVANFSQIVQYHRDRVREGAMAEVDLMRVELERDRIRTAALLAGQDAVRATILLQREMGRSDFAPVVLSDRLGERTDAAPPQADSVLALRPEVAVARRIVARAEANQRLQKALAKPDPEVTFGYKRSTGFHTLMGAVQIDLPFSNRNQGNIGAATAEIRAAQADLTAIENAVRADVAAAWADYQARRSIVEDVLRPMRARADEIARIAQAAYREGGADLLRLLDAERARIDSLTMYFRALAEFQQSVTTLQIVTGAPL